VESSVIRRIHRLREMTVGELQVEWQRLYGEPSRSRNRDFLWRRLAWRLQELRLGGLSNRARARLEELGQTDFQRARTPGVAADEAPAGPVSRNATPNRLVHDIRLPTVGSVITKRYKGRELRVVVRDGGYEYDGAVFDSLSALAREITGSSHINGKLFWGVTQRKRKA